MNSVLHAKFYYMGRFSMYIYVKIESANLTVICEDAHQNLENLSKLILIYLYIDKEITIMTF